jgi:monoamine oxidase
MAREADVIIVGGGLSGLIAAGDVLAAGYEPLILEADRRVGGRILTEDVEGVPLELGAQWIGDTHHRMEALASELGSGSIGSSKTARRLMSSPGRCFGSAPSTPSTPRS